MNALIYVVTANGQKWFFLDLNSMFDFVNSQPDTVSGYVGLEP